MTPVLTARNGKTSLNLSAKIIVDVKIKNCKTLFKEFKYTVNKRFYADELIF